MIMQNHREVYGTIDGNNDGAIVDFTDNNATYLLLKEKKVVNQLTMAQRMFKKWCH